MSTEPSRSRGGPEDPDLLGQLWSLWLHAGRELPADRWDSASGLGDWTVRELYAHVSRGVSTLADLVAQPPTTEPAELTDAAAYFATLRALGPDGARGVAVAAKEFAKRPIEVLVEGFDAPETLALAREKRTAVLGTIAGRMPVGDYLLTRVLEATVHLLDLAEAVPGLPGPPTAALHRTTDVLVGLVPSVDFIRLATGRSTAALFPVLT